MLAVPQLRNRDEASRRQVLLDRCATREEPQEVGEVGTDPPFTHCYQAVAAGYGPYPQGRDSEYA
jgi:hypothetical protein